MNTPAPLVTVIIPSYNCEEYIAETLASVLGQTLSDLEIIVVDDGSQDRTREIVAAHGGQVRLVPQENSRVCAARNRGIAEARGRYICLMDHDDWWFPDKLGSQVACLEAHPEAGVVYASFILWHRDATGAFPAPASLDRSPWGEGEDPEFSGWIYHQFLRDCWMLTSTAMFRAEMFQRCGNFDVNLPYSEDWDLWLRMAREFPFVKLRRPNTLYRQHARQGSRVVRPVDYRTELLERAVATWGLCSPDGRCLERHAFRRNLATYHIEYALSHALVGNFRTAASSLFKAWRADPSNPKPLAYLVALTVGWRPNWHRAQQHIGKMA